ncbi:Uncharacterised protein [[Clostridium] sordellii]|uniref:hypothetical protein n=1 Tax=Paraclostridium sordellii TaxID=1505 RepID=UPI0005E0FE64|nr:hypothetical protein [Paeniclostridium sordellii]CEP88569.1 Uncharacterised protein [[Clostridium] sordellii] [Paeniclostridium sordellii]
MSYIELVKELRKTMLNIKKETKNLENTIKGTSKLEDLDDVEVDFEELKNQILILDEELEEFEETVNDEEFQALQIYQEPISCDTYGIGPWQ